MWNLLTAFILAACPCVVCPCGTPSPVERGEGEPTLPGAPAVPDTTRVEACLYGPPGGWVDLVFGPVGGGGDTIRVSTTEAPGGTCPNPIPIWRQTGPADTVANIRIQQVQTSPHLVGVELAMSFGKAGLSIGDLSDPAHPHVDLQVYPNHVGAYVFFGYKGFGGRHLCDDVFSIESTLMEADTVYWSPPRGPPTPVAQAVFDSIQLVSPVATPVWTQSDSITVSYGGATVPVASTEGACPAPATDGTDLPPDDHPLLREEMVVVGDSLGRRLANVIEIDFELDSSPLLRDAVVRSVGGEAIAAFVHPEYIEYSVKVPADGETPLGTDFAILRVRALQSPIVRSVWEAIVLTPTTFDVRPNDGEGQDPDPGGSSAVRCRDRGRCAHRGLHGRPGGVAGPVPDDGHEVTLRVPVLAGDIWQVCLGRGDASGAESTCHVLRFGAPTEARPDPDAPPGEDPPSGSEVDPPRERGRSPGPPSPRDAGSPG